MSRFYVWLVNVVAVNALTTISSERVVNRGSFDRIERRGDIVSSRDRDVVLFTDSSSIFFLHLLKYKPQYQYQKLDKIESTTPAPVTRDCICVPFYLCDSNQTIITDGIGVIDVRARKCTGDLEVCCYPRNVTATPPTALPTITFPTSPPTTPPTTFPTAPPATPSPSTPTPSATTPTVPPTTVPPIVFPISPSPGPPATGLPNCICVPMSLCDPNGIVTVSGEGVINPRYGLCPGDLVCCRTLANATQPPTSPPTTMAPVTVTPAPPGQTQLCFVCGNATLCFTCTTVITPDGGSLIDPRFSQILSEGNVCTARSVPSCRNASSDAPGSTMDLGPPRNPGTPQECYCVRTWLCSEGHAVSPDGLGAIDSRFTACSSADQVCCRLAGIDRQGLRNAAVTFFAPGSNVADELSDRSSSRRSLAVYGTIVTRRPFPPDSEKTYFAEFPWMVALLQRSATDGPRVFRCGASLISNGAVLTAAHCVASQKPENLIARFGQWDIGSNAQPLPAREARILAIAVHPSYYSGGLFHDVAVLVLAEPVTYSANVLPICLPEQGKVFPSGTRCYGTGWGSDSFGPEGQYQAELRKVSLPIVNRGDCQTRLRGTKLGRYFELHGSFICAGGEVNRDTCRGDGGGPLVCRAATGQFFQAGIVSWGIGCGASNVPAVYASVSQHREWIDRQFATYGV